MTEFLGDLAAERRRLLERAEELSSVWGQVQAATGSDATAGLVPAELARTRRELEENRFTVGLFGLIKRGKSTLLNALLGNELSPTHVTPETAVPVYVDHGPPGATVHFASGEHRDVTPSEVGQWTSLKHNPGNRHGVTHVQWTYPSPLLRHGVRVVDTPGLDDAEADDLYIRRTVQELETADAGILVFLSPPTVGATEMGFLGDVAAANLRKTLLVANLYPQHYHDADTRAAVVDYVQRRLSQATGETDVRLHVICAEEAWQARRYGDDAGWERAGGASLLAALESTIAANTGHRALERAEAAIDRTASVATAAIEVRLQVLTGGTAEEQQERAREHRERLVDDGDLELERRLTAMSGLRTQLQALVHQSFVRTRAALREADSVEELDAVLARFSREVEVVTEDAFRVLWAQLARLHDELSHAFQSDVAATLHDLGAVLPGMRALRADDHRTPAPSAIVDAASVRNAAVGGVVAGGAGFALVGALLGPVGLVAGAIAGWQLGAVVRRGRELRPLRDEISEQLSVIADAVLAEFDARVDGILAAVRESARQHREGFTVDLTDLVSLVDRFPAGTPARHEAVAALRRLSAHVRHLPGSPERLIQLESSGRGSSVEDPAGVSLRTG